MQDNQTFEFNGKVHMFAEPIIPNPEGLFIANLVDHNNVRCELLFKNGKLYRITELEGDRD